MLESLSTPEWRMNPNTIDWRNSMQTLKSTIIALAVTGALGSSLTVLAAGNHDKPFEGLVVEDFVVLEQIPEEVESGSIALDEDGDDSDRTLAGLARLTFSEAADVALRALPGKVISTRLDNENGYLVWNVEVVGPDHQEVEFMIDAGNGRLLAAENEDDDDDGDTRWNWKFWEDNDKD